MKSIFLLSVFLCAASPLLTAQQALTGIELAKAAEKLTEVDVTYDGRYFSIPYPNGDVPSHLGVCTDVVIRAYRAFDIDLQSRVHRDMSANFERYPSQRIWGLHSTDTNIDHRRVPNLQVFFKRKGESLGLSQKPEDYVPGDIVSWDLGEGITHIGIVSSVKSERDPDRYLIVHNIGGGQVLEDCLFSFRITGHYRYLPQ